MKTLNVKRTTIQEIQDNWNMPIPCFGGSEYFVRCNSKGIVNWDNAPIMQKSDLDKRGYYMIIEEVIEDSRKELDGFNTKLDGMKIHVNGIGISYTMFNGLLYNADYFQSLVVNRRRFLKDCKEQNKSKYEAEIKEYARIRDILRKSDRINKIDFKNL
jgi:hypothetical protein